jgi:hypothetical protein
MTSDSKAKQAVDDFGPHGSGQEAGVVLRLDHIVCRRVPASFLSSVGQFSGSYASTIA